MPIARTWAEEEDNIIITMRANGETWAAIAIKLSMSRNTIIERGRKLHVAKGSELIRMKRTAENQLNQSNLTERNGYFESALPAGHPEFWNMLWPNGAPKPFDEVLKENFRCQQN
jgi:hypothetical protein